jgi:hypothetical protein
MAGDQKRQSSCLDFGSVKGSRSEEGNDRVTGQSMKLPPTKRLIACVLLSLVFLTNQAMTANFTNFPAEPTDSLQNTRNTPEVQLSLEREKPSVPPSGVTRETQDDSADSFDADPKAPADLASEAGVTAAFVITCGNDPAPVRSAFNSMLKSLKLDADTEAYLLQRYHSTILSAEMTLEREQPGFCRNLSGTLRSTIRDLSSPAS